MRNSFSNAEDSFSTVEVAQYSGGCFSTVEVVLFSGGLHQCMQGNNISTVGNTSVLWGVFSTVEG